MSAHPPAPACALRHPWPDEIARAYALLPALQTGAFRRSWLWVLVTGVPERLVGAVAVQERHALDLKHPPAPGAHIECALQPLWRTTEMTERLVSTACEAAAELRLGALTCAAEAGSSLEACLIQRGFTLASTHELWGVSPESSLREFGATFLRGFGRHGAAVTAPLAAGDLEEVRALCGRYRLLPPERISLQPERLSLQPASLDGFDPRFSFVHAPGGSVRAAVLARLQGNGVYLEVFARDQALAEEDPTVTPALAFALLGACREHGIRELTCVVRPEATPELVHLLRRAGGQLVKKVGAYTLNRS